MIKQGTKEWHEWRRQGIGASEAPDIMGIGYNTPYEWWARRVGLIPNKEITSSMQRGNDLEPLARMEFERMTGIKMTPALKEHHEIPWLRCSLDGLSEQGQVLEIKALKKEYHEMALNGDIPPIYYPQCQHQMKVLEVSFVYYFSIDVEFYLKKSKIRGKVLEIDRDNSYIDNMLSKETKAWKCLQLLEEPELIDRDFLRRDDIEWQEAAEQWKYYNAQRKLVEDKEQEARNKLIELSGNTNSKGYGVRLTKSMRKGNVDYHSIEELKAINLDQYRKPPSVTYRIGAI